jgi:tRNA (guanine-N7-)-methyltransferase
MGKYKLRQFAELATFPNALEHLQHGKEVDEFALKGKWNEVFFRNTNPLVLELGCGKGEYTLALSQQNTGYNYLGVDVKGNRIWRGAKTALEEKINHVGFLRCRVENIATTFAAAEVQQIWITFPDPQPGIKREKRRLTAPRQLAVYRKILSNNGILHLKTDSRMLHDYTVDVLKHEGEILFQTTDLYKKSSDLPETERSLLTGVQTYYEKKFLAQGIPICYLQFKLKPLVP